MRYLLLLIFNLPIVITAFLSLVTKYKLKHITQKRFRIQTILWFIVLLVLILSYPVFNVLSGQPFFDSESLSLISIVQTTAIIFLLYATNNLRLRIEENERRLRDLHQELSIRLSEPKHDGKD